MAESNKINAVLIDGELADVSIDDDTGLYTHGEPEIDMEREIEDQQETEETNKRRKWFGAGKRKDEADVGTKEIDAESGRSKEEVGDDSDDKSVFGNFAASVLNVCTFGLFSSSSSSSPKEPDKKFLSVIMEDERERESYQLESEQSQGRTRTMTTRDQDLVSEYSIASNDIDNNSAEPILSISRSYKETRVKTTLNIVLCHSCMVLIFLAMAVLFIIGGILWKRNGF